VALLYNTPLMKTNLTATV